MKFKIRHIIESDRAKIKNIIEKEWGSNFVISRRKQHDVHTLSGFVAVDSGNIVGLLTFRLEKRACEVITLNSFNENMGIGTGLIEAICDYAQKKNCSRLWLITTNDNLSTVGFYQKRGFTLKAVYPNEIEHSRKMKPEIPMYGIDGLCRQRERYKGNQRSWALSIHRKTLGQRRSVDNYSQRSGKTKVNEKTAT